jgi:hypothetical protein
VHYVMSKFRNFEITYRRIIYEICKSKSEKKQFVRISEFQKAASMRYEYARGVVPILCASNPSCDHHSTFEEMKFMVIGRFCCFLDFTGDPITILTYAASLKYHSHIENE